MGGELRDECNIDRKLVHVVVEKRQQRGIEKRANKKTSGRAGDCEGNWRVYSPCRGCFPCEKRGRGGKLR